jgi:hypothetical protein
MNFKIISGPIFNSIGPFLSWGKKINKVEWN